MAISGTYSDPSASITEVISPTGINPTSAGFFPCLVGTASRNKRAVNEAVIRGLIKNEALTVASTAPHNATLSTRGDRRVSNTTVVRTSNNVATTLTPSQFSYAAASILGVAAGPFNVSSNNAFALQLDGNGTSTPTPLTFILRNRENLISAGITSGTTWAAPFRFPIGGNFLTTATITGTVTTAAPFTITIVGLDTAGSPLTSTITMDADTAGTYVENGNGHTWGVIQTATSSAAVAGGGSISLGVAKLIGSSITSGTAFTGPFPIPSGSGAIYATTTGSPTFSGSPGSVTVTVTGTDLSNSPQTGTITIGTPTQAGTYTGTTQAWNSITSIVLSAAITAGSITVSAGSDYASVEGSQVFTGTNLSSAGTAATRAQIAEAINTGLAAASALGYGSAYSAVASDGTSGVAITSPVTTFNSDVRVFAAPSNNASTTLFGSSTLDAATVLTIANTAYASTATYVASYVSAASVNSPTDALANTPVQKVVAVGSFPGLADFVLGTDYQLTGNTIDFSIATAASAKSLVASSWTITENVNDQLFISIDGKAVVTIDLLLTTTESQTDLGSPAYPYNFTPASSPMTPANIATAINDFIMADANYGPRYQSVATSTANQVTITSPTTGITSQVLLSVPSSGSPSGMTTIFGISGTTLYGPGAGRSPGKGSTYFVTYDFTRPISDYNRVMQFNDVNTALLQTGPVSASTFLYNPLAQGVQVAFKNGAQSVFIVQINDATTPGTPLSTEVQAAIDSAGVSALCTDVIVIDEPGTRIDIQVYLEAHVETQTGPVEKHYRRGWCGMPAGTLAGDADTAGTYANRAARTLQPSPTSPARGRMFLVAAPQPAGYSVTLTLDDGSTVRRTLDSTYLAVAAASLKTSIAAPETLTGRTLQGFNVDDITNPWSRQDRASMAGNGVLVVTFDSGRFLMKDALTTEAGGGNLVQFKVDSTSYQKDNITVKIAAALTNNVVGVVPFDLLTFVTDVKIIMAGVITGEISARNIAPFVSSDGTGSRPIDLRTDINVAQNPTDKTDYKVAYQYYLRYPALRIEGSFSVDTGSFSANANTGR